MSEITFIGTSDAFGSGGRRQAANFVRAPDGGILLDCGPTTLTGMAALGIPRDELDTIVISHYHGDHFGGIPLLLLAAKYTDKRSHPIRIVGPADVKGWVERASAALGHPHDEDEWPFEIIYQDFNVGADVDIGPGRLRAFDARHQPETKPHGIVVDAGGTKIAYSGDTGWFEELPSHVAGVDLFITECTQYNGDFPLHLTHLQLEEHKSAFDCGRIILTHLGPEMSERRGTCSFETADDGLIIRV